MTQKQETLHWLQMALNAGGEPCKLTIDEHEAVVTVELTRTGEKRIAYVSYSGPITMMKDILRQAFDER